MLEIKLFNSLTKRKEIFAPQQRGSVSLYTCGPTVYNFAHLGNLRSFIFADILKRTFQANSIAVKQIINITDVGHLTSNADEGEDKVAAAAKKEKKTAQQITAFYTQSVKADIKKLNILPPKKWPRASQHIKEQIGLIKKLVEGGFTYVISDGVYFDTAKFRDYATLFNRGGGDNLQSRIKKIAGKKQATDFALWKFSPVGIKRLQVWPSPWGNGFPGWHIECSAMSLKYLSYPIDIHTGGIDHLTVHHPNEIAQSEAAGYKPFVRFWLHNEYLVLPAGKMSKSKGGFITLSNLINKGYDPLAFRYFCLNAHYRQKLTFSWSALKAAASGLKHLRALTMALPKKSVVEQTYLNKFKTALNDDLNTPQALAIAWEVLRQTKLTPAQKTYLVKKFDQVLALDLFQQVTIPPAVRTLVVAREKARQDKNWLESDRLRDKILILGFVVEDTIQGPVVKKK